MKKLYLIGALLIISTAVLLFTACETTTGGAPTSFAIEAASDSTVKLTWVAPTEGTPDNYIVYFKEVGTSSFTVVQELGGTVLTYTDNPSGTTGTYYVLAKFGSNEYKSDEKNTIPIHGTATSLAEVNATGNSGYGWSRTNGSAGSYSMTVAANASAVDLYISNWAGGYTSTPYYVISPDLGPTDPGNAGVPTGGWRLNGISTNSVNEQDPLPAHSGTNYVSSTSISTDPIFLGVWTADGYFALIKASGVNTGAGTVQVESWFQSVKGLRLIQH